MNEKIAQNSVRGEVCPVSPPKEMLTKGESPGDGIEKTPRNLRRAARFKRALRRFKNNKAAVSITGAIIIVLLSLNLPAQIAEIKPLKIGERVPDEIWQQSFPVIGDKGAATDSVRLSDYKGKLILLDFWATWCTACIRKFDYLNALQERKKGNLAVLLVNANIKGDTEQKMRARLNGTGLSSIVFNKSLKALFPHAYIPHCIWIGPDGKLLAITNGELIGDTLTDALLAHSKN